MTNEIKEILDNIKNKYEDYYVQDIVSGKDLKLLLDYITNLQNEIFDLKDTIQNKNDCIGAYACIIDDRDKRIDTALDYIYLNFSNEDDGSIWHQDFKIIKDILRGDE